MDARLMDIISAVGSFLLFIALLIFLPGLMDPGIAYIIAIVVFIAVMSTAGYLINTKFA
jgi:ABC-type dipeptide/oligopeptide/nickel transport system permease subunit